MVCLPRHPLTKAPAPPRPLPLSSGAYPGSPQSISPPSPHRDGPPPTITLYPTTPQGWQGWQARRCAAAVPPVRATQAKVTMVAAPRRSKAAMRRSHAGCGGVSVCLSPAFPSPLLTAAMDVLVAPTTAVICFFRHTSTGRLYLPPTPSPLTPLQVCSLKGRFFIPCRPLLIPSTTPLLTFPESGSSKIAAWYY